jgi:hypothetical protein
MSRHTNGVCYFCTEGEQAIELLEASLQQSIAADSEAAARLQRRLRALQHTLGAHHCTR